MTENEEKRLEMIREKIAQMRAQEKTIIARDKARQRKERTRRLIKYGELVEKYFECRDIEPLEVENMLKEIRAKNGEVL